MAIEMIWIHSTKRRNIKMSLALCEGSQLLRNQNAYQHHEVLNEKCAAKMLDSIVGQFQEDFEASTNGFYARTRLNVGNVLLLIR